MPLLDSLKSYWQNHKIKLGLSIFCVGVATFDTFFKALSPIAGAALSIAIVPWVIDFIEKISAPGGFEIVFKNAAQQLRETETNPDVDDLNAFQYVKTDDPNLAIAVLRIEIEKRLRQIAEDVGVGDSEENRRTPLSMLTEKLRKDRAISAEAASLIRDLMPAMNQAVHGVTLQKDATEFALEYGPKILSLLKVPPHKAA